MKKCQKCFSILADHAARCHCGEDLISVPQLSEKDLKKLYIRFPFFWIFFRPKKTILHILEYYKPLSACIILFIGYLIQLPKTYEIIEKYNIETYLPKNILGYSELSYLSVGFLAFLLSFYIFAAFISITGKWINGTGNTANVFIALSWSSIPFFIIPLLEYLFPIFINNYFLPLFVITSILTIWGFVVQIICISVVHSFSATKVIVNSILAIVITVFVGLIMIVGIMYLGNSLSLKLPLSLNPSNSSYRTISPNLE